jgi:nucleotide-binding universal stress UspA family protein
MSAPDGHAVVAAVDGRTGGADALAYAVAEALRGGDSLHLVHVWPGSSPHTPVAVGALHSEGRAVLDRSLASARVLAPDLAITTELVVGPRSAGILTAARGGRLLVVGRSHRARVEAPLGGTPAALATRAECPVVIVPSAWTTPAGPGRVVVGMKARTHARELLSHAFGIAHERGAGVEVVTAWELYDPPMDRAEVRDHADKWAAEGVSVLGDLVHEWRETFPSVPVELHVTHGHAATVLENASAGADLLLVARHACAVPPYGHLGSTAHTLLRTSRCPVEVVPAGVVAGVPIRPTRALRST